MILIWVLHKENPCSLLRRLRAFLFLSLTQTSLVRAKNKNPHRFRDQGFFFVAEGGFEPPTFGL